MSAAFAEQEAAWLAGCGFELRLGVRVGQDVSFAELEQSHDAVFLGLGLERPLALGIPGESLPGVVDALELIAAHRGGRPLPVALDGH